jgi:hypothetical protein
MHHVCYFRHALALNERRVKMQPEYAHGGLSVVNSHVDLRSREEQIKEVWFVGTHGDVLVEF